MLKTLRVILTAVVVLSLMGVAQPSFAQDYIVMGESMGSVELVEAAKREGRVVVYTSQGAVDEQMIAEGFQARFPEIRVEIVRLVGGRLYERVMTERRGGRVGADVIVLSDQALMELLAQEGVLADHTPPSDALYPEDGKRSGQWYAFSGALMQPIYNSAIIPPEEAPKSWADLLDPKWKGQIGLTPAGIGGTAWSVQYFLRKELGIEYWQRLAAQQPTIYTGSARVVQAVISGENLIGIIVDGTAYRERVHQGAPIEVVYPTEGSVLFNYTVGVADGGPNPNAGRLYVNWYLHMEGQMRVAAVRGTYSRRPDVPAPLGKPPIDTVTLYMPDGKELLELRDQWVEEWNEIFEYR